MRYRIELSRRAHKDLASLPRTMQKRIHHALVHLEDDLAGDVKRLAEHRYDYRLRIGDYRVLFNLEDGIIAVKRIGHRRQIYRRP